MPPLLFICGALASVIALGEFVNDRIGPAAFVWAGWGIALLAGVVATLVPSRTRILRGLITGFIGAFFTIGSLAFFFHHPDFDTGFLAVFAGAFSLGAFSYTRFCLMGSSLNSNQTEQDAEPDL